ncbi:MAG: zinc-ribbon domain-containing protein [Candidatus Heimdallarchaeota archaeon]|nr:zinc-ribbon domain-containing protein [Candidatus Heimdallarchaeota archaeon]
MVKKQMNTKHCPFCGSIIEEGSAFCANCGASLSSIEETQDYDSYTPEEPSTPPPPPPPQQKTYDYGTGGTYREPSAPRTQESNTMGIISLIFGILGCVGVLPCIGSLVAIVTGFMGKDHPEDSMAKIGLILGFLGCCAWLIGIIIWIVVIVTSIPYGYYYFISPF